MEKGTVFQNRFGVYKHDDIIGKEYGSKVIDSLKNTIKKHFIHESIVGFFKLQRICLFTSPHTRALDTCFTTSYTNFIYCRHFIYHHIIGNEAWC